MRKKQSALLKILLSGICLSSLCLAVAGCQNQQQTSNYEMPEYVYNDPYAPMLDEGVTLDGVLNESFWQNNQALVRGIDYLGIDCRMNSYLGEYGVYMSFEVNDHEVYYNAGRAAYSNTGIELYVSSPSGEIDLYKNAYEIDFNAGGRVDVRKKNKTGYTDVSDNAMSGAVINGEINTSTCQGYVIEAFMPYEMFGGKVDFVYVMPALIRSNSDIGSSRLWFNLLTENDGATNAYVNAKNWYVFNENGIFCYKANSTKTGTGNGTVTMENIALPGKSFNINVKPDDDSYISSVKINGKEIIDAIEFTFEGGFYTIEKVTEEIEVVVEFTKIPTGSSQLLLNLTQNKYGVKSPAEGAHVVIKDKNAVEIFNQTMGADGKATVGVLNNESYTITCSLDGYIVEEELFALTENTVYTKELQYQIFEEANAHYDISKANDGIIQAKKSGSADIVFTEQSDDFYLEINLKAGKEITNDARFYLKFYDKKGGNYGVRTMEQYGTSTLNGIAFCGFGASDYISWKNYQFNDAQLEAMYGDGLKLAFVRASGIFYVYVEDVAKSTFVTALSKPVAKSDTVALSKFMPYEITDMKYETSKSFGTFVTNPMGVWDYKNAESGSVEFTGNTGILQFAKQAENFSLEFTYKRTTNTQPKQDSSFYLRFIDANGHYGVRIMETDNQITNISFFTSGGANVGWKGYTFNSAQKAAMKADGLKFKLERKNGVINVYVQNLSTGEMDLVLSSTAENGAMDVVALAGWQPYLLTDLVYTTY